MLVIITGTIKPNSKVYQLALSNVSERTYQYIDSIKKILENKKVDKVIFCENSNYKVDFNEIYLLAKEKGKQFECIQFKSDEKYILLKGKGFGEGEIMKYIFEKSKLINNEKYFIKITGRLKVNNLEKIINKISKDKTYINTDLKNTSFMADTRVYGMPTNVYKKYFIDAYKSVDDKNKNYLEHAFYKIIVDNKIKTENFPYFPDISGQSGSMGIIYTNSRLKLLIKNLLSKFQMFSIRNE